MMRLVLGLVLILVGAGAGWAVSHVMSTMETLTPGVRAEPAELVAMRAELRSITDERAALAEQIAGLENENEMLRGEQALMEAVLDDAARAQQSSTETGVPADTEPAPAPEDEFERRDERRGPSPEQMAEFRRQQEEQREAMRARLDEELIRMGDPNAVQNFQALLEYRQDEEALRRQFRDAQTDAQREKIAGDLRATQEAARQLLNSQQDSILRNVAAANGIKDPAAQQKFVDETRRALANPFFSMEPMLMGGRGGPRGGAWGGRSR